MKVLINGVWPIFVIIFTLEHGYRNGNKVWSVFRRALSATEISPCPANDRENLPGASLQPQIRLCKQSTLAFV